MLKNCLVALVAAAPVFCSAAASAAQADFDQGVDVQAVVGTLAPKPQSIGSAQWTFKTCAERKVHAKGFIRKDLSGADWKSYRSMQADIPDTLDLRPSLTQIEDQGMCGSCWAFSLTATHRDGHALGGGDPGRLSQEWLVEHSKEAQGCNGGDFDSANELANPGQPLWSACPYRSGHGNCPADMKPAARIKGWHMLGVKGKGPTTRDIEAYMASSGKPISIAVAAAAGAWESYDSGIYNGCKYGELDHMINIVGWDNEGAAFDAKGNLPPGKGVWILRNSWGKSWGEKGYMRSRMSDESGQRCNAVGEEASYFDF